jgi:hypothetical protein
MKIFANAAVLHTTDINLTLNLSKKLEMMNELRKTRHVSEAGEDMRKLWVWYGLELMVEVSRKEWAWRKLINRTTKLFTDCVVVGDEALALQVISLSSSISTESELDSLSCRSSDIPDSGED